MRITRAACRVAPLLLALGAGAVACAKSPERARREFVESGDRLAARKEYRQAIVQYRNALQHDPRFGEARVKLADTYVQAGDPQSALSEYVRAADLLRDDMKAQMKAATFLLAAEQFEDARVRVARVLKKEPKNVDALVLLGRALAGLRDFEAALKQIEQAVELDAASAPAYATLGIIQAARGRQKDAEDAFRQAVATNPERADVHLALANFLWSGDRVGEAEASLRRAVDLEPGNSLANRALATFYLSTGRAPEAEHYLRAAAETDTNPAAPLKLALADYYVSVDRPDRATALLEKLAKSGPTRSAAGTRLAVLAYDNKSHAEGHRQIDSVLASHPREVSAIVVKARFLLQDGRTDEALEKVRGAVAIDPTSVPAHYLLGSIHRLRGDIRRAMGAFNDVLRLNPRVTSAQVELARLNLATGRTDVALTLSESAAQEVPEDGEVQLTLARSLLANGQVRRAEPIVRTLAARFPQSAAAVATLGHLQARKEEGTAARKSFARALDIDPVSMDAMAGMAALDIAENRPEAARARVDAFLERVPRSASAFVFGARIHGATGSWARAESLLKGAIDVDASNLEAFRLLGHLYASQNRLDAARDAFEAIANTRPEEVSAHTMVAMIHEMQGNIAEARQRYERIVRTDTDAAVACNNLAYIYAEHGGNLDVALQLAQRARQKLPEAPQVADTLGWVYYRKGVAQLAVPMFQEAVVKEPTNPTYQYRLGLAYLAVGERRKGRETLMQVLSIAPESPEAGEARKALAGG